MVALENTIEKKRKDDLLLAATVYESSFDLFLAFYNFLFLR